MLQPVTMEIGIGILQMVRIHSPIFVHLIIGLNSTSMNMLLNILENGYQNYNRLPQNHYINGKMIRKNISMLNNIRNIRNQ